MEFEEAKETINHPLGGGRRRAKKSPTATGKSCIIVTSPKLSTRKADAVSSRKYTIKKPSGLHLTQDMRLILARAWNAYINSSTTITIRRFASLHGLSVETWRRELLRGATGAIVRRGNKWFYPEAVLELKRSPYDARMMIVEAFPDKDIPCLKTFYNHIEAGDMGVFHGDTPYHPGKKRKPRQTAHEAKTVPGRHQLADRPKEASHPKVLGHWEMDTILSCKGLEYPHLCEREVQKQMQDYLAFSR